MELGTHNSFTYLNPVKWWMKLLKWTAKCLSVDIKKLYELGSRCFDLRVRFKDNKLILAHGIIEYPIELLFNDLEFLNSKNVSMRVILEFNSCPNDLDTQSILFAKFCAELETKYPNIKFFGGRAKWNSKKQLYIFSNSAPSLDDKYASTDSLKYINDIWPWIYSIFFNKYNKKKGTDKDILFIDFINI